MTVYELSSPSVDELIVVSDLYSVWCSPEPSSSSALSTGSSVPAALYDRVPSKDPGPLCSGVASC